MVEDESKGVSPHIDFIDSSEGKYYEGSRKYGGSVMPDLKPEEFILLPPNDSLEFNVNIAKFYEFDALIAAGFRHFSIAYGANMPFINSRFEHLFERKKISGQLKPVFVAVTVSKATKNNKYLSQRAYFTFK